MNPTVKLSPELDTISQVANSLKQEDPVLFQRVANIFDIACKEIYPFQTLPAFTEHGLLHIRNILNKTDELLAGGSTNKILYPGECFLLLTSLLLHDIGQLSHNFIYNDSIETYQKHAQQSEDLILENADKFGLDEHEVSLVAKLCSSHGLHDYRVHLKEHWNTESLGDLRLHVIAAILRISDLLDLTSSRTPSFIFRQRRLPYESKKHWQRHAVITNVKIDSRDWSIKVFTQPKEIKQLFQLETFRAWLQSELSHASIDLRTVELFYSRILLEIDDSKYCKYVVATNKNNPFQGLRPFEFTHSSYFFGRDHEVETILSIIQKHQFLSLVGESGVGKTSIVNAGILPEIREYDYITQNAKLSESIDMPIGTYLLRSIAKAVDLSPNSSITDIIERFSIYNKQKQDFILIIDQFEEIFTLSFNDMDKATFIKNLMQLMTSSSNFKVIISIRSEFLIDLWELVKGNKLLFSGATIHRLKKLSPERAKEVVMRPMIKFKNLKWCTKLVDEFIDDLTDEGAGIYPPYLSLVCSNLVQAKFGIIQRLHKDERKANFEIGLDLYTEMGKAENIINKEFQTILDAFSPSERVVIDRVLSRMITEFHSKKPIHSSDVDAINNGKIDIGKAMNKLVNKRVVKQVHFGYELEHDLVARKLVEILKKSVRASSQIGSVIEHMQNYMKRPLSNQELAKTAGLSKAQFSRRFKKETGNTPLKHLQNLRIENARWMLRESEEPINLVCNECGFGTMANFINVFKQLNNGITPSDYRRSFREQNLN